VDHTPVNLKTLPNILRARPVSPDCCT